MRPQHLEQPTKTAGHKTFPWKWFMAACCLGLLVIFVNFQRCPYDYYAKLSYRHVNYTAGERAVMRKLSDMLQECPGSSRYIIEWGVDGEQLWGIVPQTTIYDRKKKTFRHYWGFVTDSGRTLSWSSSDVTVEDIHSVAAPGDYDRLRERVRRLRAKKNQ